MESSAVLSQLILLLAFCVLVVAALRRLRLPAIVGYLAVGMLLGPDGLNIVSNVGTTQVLSELGVVFLVFTLGLEFSLPRMIAMRNEVLFVGGGQVILTMAVLTGILAAFHVQPLVAVIIGGALAMSSTAIVIRQLAEQLEINRTHARIAVGILLFQDLAFVPLLALEAALSSNSEGFDFWIIAGALLRAAIALALVLGAGRWLLRPLFHEIGKSRSNELFTLTALLVSLGAAWLTHFVGLSMAVGAFLAGMLLAESEYRHQIETVIRPFRDVLLGLFFITIGTLLDLPLLVKEIWIVLLLVIGLQVFKAAVVTAVAKRAAKSLRKAIRTGLVVAQGGEFGFALLTLMLNDKLASPSILQPLLAATVVGMALSPFLIRHNGRIARFLLRRDGAELNDLAREHKATHEAAQRDHVIVCGFGRVGQNLARVLERQGFEYIAIDLDPNRVRNARQAGEPIVYGDGAHADILDAVGLERCSVLVITFADPTVSMRITRAVRELRADVPILVRTQDDSRLDELQQAGATEVVPETFEASLMLVSHALLLLNVPVSRVVKTIADIRGDRYAMMRRVFRRVDAPHQSGAALSEELSTVVLPPRAFAVGKRIEELKLADLEVVITALRRDGIVGRQPEPHTLLREGDVIVLYGTPEALEHGEAHLLMG